MKKCHLQLFLLFTFYLFSSLTPLKSNNIVGSAPAEMEDVCTLAPPAVFTIVQVGTTWADVTWSPVPGAVGYHIKTYESVSGNLVNDMFVTNVINGAKITGLAPDVSYFSKIWSVCSGQEDGPTAKTSSEFRTIIIDYVAQGYTHPAGIENWSAFCGNLGLGGCNYVYQNNGLSRTYFIIKKNDDYNIQLHFSLNVENHITMVRANTADPDYLNGKFSFDDDGNFLYIYYGNPGVKIATLSISHVGLSPTGLFFRVQNGNLPGYTIDRLDPPGMGFNTSDNGNEKEYLKSTTFLSASPNPFTNTIDLQIPYATPENDVNIHLYDLQGRLMLSEKTPSDTQIRILPSETLLPGLYLLRVNTGDKTETIKVMKTQ